MSQSFVFAKVVCYGTNVHNKPQTQGGDYKKEEPQHTNRVLRFSNGAPEHSIIEPFTSFKVTVLLASL